MSNTEVPDLTEVVVAESDTQPQIQLEFASEPSSGTSPPPTTPSTSQRQTDGEGTELAQIGTPAQETPEASNAEEQVTRDSTKDRWSWIGTLGGMRRLSGKPVHQRSLSSPEILDAGLPSPQATSVLGINVRDVYLFARPSQDNLREEAEAEESSSLQDGSPATPSAAERKSRISNTSFRRFLFGSGADEPSKESSRQKERLTDPEAVDELARKLNAPEHFFCPISMELMRVPTLITSGQTFEKQAISDWCRSCEGGNLTCPITRQGIQSPPTLIMNLALRDSIEEWAQKHCPEVLGEDGHVIPHPREEGEEAFPVEVPTTINEMLDTAQLEDVDAWGDIPRRRSRGTAADRNMVILKVRIPVVLLFFITHVIATFVIMQRTDFEFVSSKVNPMIGWGVEDLRKMGALCSNCLQREAQVWRIFTSPLIHSGLIQQIVNSAGYLMLGWKLEQVYSSFRLLPIYVLSCVISTMVVGTFVSITQGQVIVGASGVFFGLLGAVFADTCAHWNELPMFLPSTKLNICLVTIAQLFMGVMPFMDNLLNLSAFIGGFLAGIVMLIPPPPTTHHDPWPEIQMAASVLIIVCIITGIVLLLMSPVNTKMSGHIQSCFESAWWDCNPKAAIPPPPPSSQFYRNRGP